MEENQTPRRMVNSEPEEESLFVGDERKRESSTSGIPTLGSTKTNYDRTDIGTAMESSAVETGNDGAAESLRSSPLLLATSQNSVVFSRREVHSEIWDDTCDDRKDNYSMPTLAVDSLLHLPSSASEARRESITLEHINANKSSSSRLTNSSAEGLSVVENDDIPMYTDLSAGVGAPRMSNIDGGDKPLPKRRLSYLDLLAGPSLFLKGGRPPSLLPDAYDDDDELATPPDEDNTTANHKYSDDWPKPPRANTFIGTNLEDWAVQDAKRFDDLISTDVTTLEKALSLLRRTRAVTVMSNRLLLAQDESKCFEEVSMLLVSLFKVTRCSYALLVDAEHFTVVQCAVSEGVFSRGMETGVNFKLEGTGVGHCIASKEILYTPEATKSPFTDHQKISAMGMNTLLNVPILVNGGKVAGCLDIGEKAEHAFSEHDRILVKDIAATLGSHIYSKRLQRAEQEAHRVSKELLDSMIPPKVLSKIEHFWGSEARSSTVSKANSIDSSFVGTPDLLRQISVKQDKTDRKERFKQIESRLKKLQSISADDVSTNFVCDIHANPNLETVPFEPSVPMKPFATSPQTTTLEGDPVKVVGVDDEAEQRALYAEERRHTSIIFTDIVGFSRISLKVRPIQVMDMLQSLFYRFDKLCDVHGVLKLETVGDAYLVSSGLLDDDTDEDAGRAHAIRALNMAKDMVQQAQKVMAPRTNPSDPVEFLEIRVGIHVGDLTCGILGQNLPKFSVFGNAVNMAARMEQTSSPSMIHVSREFHDLIGDYESGWGDMRLVPVKNMGTVETWLLDPSEPRNPADGKIEDYR